MVELWFIWKQYLIEPHLAVQYVGQSGARLEYRCALQSAFTNLIVRFLRLIVIDLSSPRCCGAPQKRAFCALPLLARRKSAEADVDALPFMDTTGRKWLLDTGRCGIALVRPKKYVILNRDNCKFDFKLGDPTRPCSWRGSS